MDPKDLYFGAEARRKLLRGAKKLARAVVTTLGPKGRNVALEDRFAGGIIVHDGVTVAREIILKDPVEELGANRLKEAASKTNDASGDGTTTATLLAYEMLKEGNKHVVAGYNPMLLKKGMDKAVSEVVTYLEKQAKPIKGNLDRMMEIATVSSADAEIGKIIAEAIEKVGEYGIVTAEEGTEKGYHVEYKDGMEWDKGWHLARYAQNSLEAFVKDPFVLITDRTITSQNEIIPFLGRFVDAGHKNLLIISDGIEQMAQAILFKNLNTGVLNVLAVPAPSLGEHKRDGLEDIAVLTGGTFISEEEGRQIQTVTIEELGRADSVIADRKRTLLTGGKGNKEDIKKRAKIIEEQMNDAEHEYLKEKYQERLAKLVAGVAVIKVGTPSDTEKRERFERVKDAIGATQAAVKEGIVAGGGIALFNARAIITKRENKEENLGAEIVYQALSKPLMKLAENAGVNGEVVVNNLEQTANGVGYNVMTKKYVDMMKAGIIDPLLVTKDALVNAVSVASMLLTTEVTVTKVLKDDEKPTRQGMV